MPISDARKRANKKYNDTHTDQIRFDAPRGFKDRVQLAAQAAGVSTSQYMRDAILQRMGQEAQSDPPIGQ